ncbi:MAG: dihydroorotase [Chloroflexi bacterium]|nr:dihydroorotase [Chloroflexota bacterium]
MNGDAHAVLIRSGRVIDPANGVDTTADVLLRDGVVAEVGPGLSAPAGARTIDAMGLVVTPGFVDLHAHLREPGFEHKETIRSGTEAAVAGGFTSVCCMPNTEPALDTAAAIEFVRRTARAAGLARVYPIGAITRGRKGRELSEMAELAAAGAVAFSDDGDCVHDTGVMRHALEYSLIVRRPIVQHAEDKSLSAGGQINEGPVAARLGLEGWPRQAEEIVVARDVELAALTGAHLHVAHVSAAGSLEYIRKAKQRGLRVTAEVTPHHLTLTDRLVEGHWWSATASLPPYDTSTKVNPPLRAEEDVAALLEALKDGTINCVATDHAPHAETDKHCEYALAAFGISNIETALGSVLSLMHAGKLDLAQVVATMTSRPAAVFNLPGGTLSTGAPADVAAFDPDREWCVNPQQLRSKGKNTPLAGHFLRGQVLFTVVGGEVVFELE